MLGERGTDDAIAFMRDLSGRLANRVQLSTDGLRAYVRAVDDAFPEIDYGQIQKIYGGSVDGGRYSPAKCIGASAYRVRGNPDLEKISTSYVERPSDSSNQTDPLPLKI